MKKFLLLLVSVILFSCTTKIEEPSYTLVSFKDKPQLHFNIAEIEFKDETRNLPENDVSNQFPVKIKDQVQSWINDRLNANLSKSYKMRIILRHSSVTESEIKEGRTLSESFKIKPKYVYKAHLEVSFAIFDKNENHFSLAEMTIRNNLERKLLEDATHTDKQKLFAEMVKQLIEDFDTQVEKTAPDYLGKYLAK